LNNIVINAFGKEPRGGLEGTNIEFTYAVCKICLDPTYSGMDVSEEVVASIMNSLENEAVSLLLLSVILMIWLILIF
jgi:hypothetical protein